MNALKYYVFLLCLGLMVLGFNAPAAAQTASGQTKAVVPRHPQPLPDLDSAQQARVLEFLQNDPATRATAPSTFPDSAQIAAQREKNPQRGMPTPLPIEIMVNEGKYAQAVSEFEKYMDTAQGDPCDLIYLPFTFYRRLLDENPFEEEFYQGKVNFYIDKFLETCGNTVEGYQFKEGMMEPKIPDSAVVWMTKAIELDSTVNMLYLIRGHALWELQRTREACADYKKAAELQNWEAADMYEQRCSDQ